MKKNLAIDLADAQDEISLIAVVLAVETLRDDRYQAESSIPYVRLVLRLVN